MLIRFFHPINENNFEKNSDYVRQHGEKRASLITPWRHNFKTNTDVIIFVDFHNEIKLYSYNNTNDNYITEQKHTNGYRIQQQLAKQEYKNSHNSLKKYEQNQNLNSLLLYLPTHNQPAGLNIYEM